VLFLRHNVGLLDCAPSSTTAASANAEFYNISYHRSCEVKYHAVAKYFMILCVNFICNILTTVESVRLQSETPCIFVFIALCQPMSTCMSFIVY